MLAPAVQPRCRQSYMAAAGATAGSASGPEGPVPELLSSGDDAARAAPVVRRRRNSPAAADNGAELQHNGRVEVGDIDEVLAEGGHAEMQLPG